MGISSIIFDIFILFIIILSAILGWRSGLVASVFNLIGFLFCMVASVLLTSPAKSWLLENTTFADKIKSHISDTITSNSVGESFFEIMPNHLRGVFEEYTQIAADKLATSLGETILTVFTFVSIFLILNITLNVIVFIISHKKDKDAIHFFNGIGGFAFGAIRGVFIVSIFMLIVTTAISFMHPESAAPAVDAIRGSVLAELIYDENPLIVILDAL